MRLELRPFSPALGFLLLELLLPTAASLQSREVQPGGFPVTLVRVYSSLLQYINSFYDNHLLS